MNLSNRERRLVGFVVASAIVALALEVWMPKVAEASGTWWTWLDPMVSFATLAAALVLWWEERRERVVGDQPITIVVVHADTGAEQLLPFKQLRRLLSRSELQGIVGGYTGPSPETALAVRGALEGIGNGPSALDLVNSGQADELRLYVSEGLFEIIVQSVAASAAAGKARTTPTVQAT